MERNKLVIYSWTPFSFLKLFSDCCFFATKPTQKPQILFCCLQCEIFFCLIKGQQNLFWDAKSSKFQLLLRGLAPPLLPWSQCSQTTKLYFWADTIPFKWLHCKQIVLAVEKSSHCGWRHSNGMVGTKTELRGFVVAFDANFPKLFQIINTASIQGSLIKQITPTAGWVKFTAKNWLTLLLQVLHYKYLHVAFTKKLEVVP